jgi:signal transduction histidine kinase
LEFELQIDDNAEQLTLTTNQKAAVKALMLLLDNAMKFTHPLAFKEHKEAGHKEHVALKVSKQGKMVIFSVEDTGIGIPHKEAERIFEEFVQLDEYYNGTGIGLTVARSLAQRIGGNIVLDTAYIGGARFVMTLPINAA